MYIDRRAMATELQLTAILIDVKHIPRNDKIKATNHGN